MLSIFCAKMKIHTVLKINQKIDIFSISKVNKIAGLPHLSSAFHKDLKSYPQLYPQFVLGLSKWAIYETISAFFNKK